MGVRRQTISSVWAATCFAVITVFVGLRHHVGMDWNNYLRQMGAVAWSSHSGSIFDIAEPGYALLLYISSLSGIGIYFANLVTAAIFAAGLVAFARRCPTPRLALLAGIPFFTVVVAMSANRQALAAGILMLIFAHWNRATPIAKLAVIALASCFHVSALIFMLFVGLDLKMPKVVKYFAAALAGVVIIYILSQTGRLDYAQETYLSQEEYAQSSGSYLQMLLTVTPALALPLLWRKRHILFGNRLVFQMAIFALLLTPLGYFFPVATARALIYVFPMTMFVFSAVPYMFQEKNRPLILLGLAIVFVAQMVAWLTFSANAIAHFPYDNFLMIDIFEWETGVLN